MLFRRSRIRYSTTPIALTPYQAAGQLWDDRIGSARVQAKNWRIIALVSVLLSCVLTAFLIVQSRRSTITPFVVEVDRQGEVHAVGAAVEAYKPTDAQIAYHLARFIRNVRSLPLDPIVLRDNWLEAYAYTTDRGANILNEYARVNDPFGHVGRSSIAIEITSIVRASGNSFQVRWIERTYANGSPTTTERWTAVVSILQEVPRDVLRIRENPLGIYVNGLDWSRELGSS
jgi:type IV secretion system protein TrbF